MTSVPNGKTPSAISCGYNCTIVLMNDGTIYGCGYNYYGQFGNNTTTNSLTLTSMTPVPGKTPSAISCGDSFTIVLMKDGTVYGCGNNAYGQLGNNTTVDSLKLTQMITTPPTIPSGVSIYALFDTTIKYPPTPAATTNYLCTISNNVVDLNTLFLPLTTQTPGPKTNYIIKNYNNTGNDYDFSNIFAPYVSGSVKSLPTNIIVFNYNNTGNNYDLSDIFQNINS
jgi:hypothetical protein